jgi:hypothetical protein
MNSYYAVEPDEMIKIITSSTSAGIVKPPPDARTGYHHSPPNPQSCALISTRDDTPALTDSTGSSPTAQGCPLLHPTCRTCALPPRACQNYRPHPFHQSGLAAVLAQPVPAPVLTQNPPPGGRCSTFHNPRAALRCGCRSDPAWGRRCVFDIWSLSNESRYMAFANRRSSRRDRVTHKNTDFSYSTKGIKVFLKLFYERSV